MVEICTGNAQLFHTLGNRPGERSIKDPHAAQPLLLADALSHYLTAHKKQTRIRAKGRTCSKPLICAPIVIMFFMLVPFLGFPQAVRTPKTPCGAMICRHASLRQN